MFELRSRKPASAGLSFLVVGGHLSKNIGGGGFQGGKLIRSLFLRKFNSTPLPLIRFDSISFRHAPRLLSGHPRPGKPEIRQCPARLTWVCWRSCFGTKRIHLLRNLIAGGELVHAIPLRMALGAGCTHTLGWRDWWGQVSKVGGI